MPKFAKGCRVPKDLKNRMRLSAERHPQPQFGRRFAAAVLPASYDARAAGLIPPIKDQGQCGDCWNFSGTFAAEVANVAGGNGTADAVNFSEQSVLDCGSNGGCDGDWPETALEQARNSGLANTAEYPYQGGPSGTCRNVPHPNVVGGYGYVAGQDLVPSVEAITTAILTYGGVAVAVAADDAFQQYTGGVFAGSGATEIDHAVGLVGWVDDAAVPGGGYWILRNSWGTAWGESGYMRIAYGANQVGYGAMWAQAGPPNPAPAPTPPAPPAPPVPPAPAAGYTGTLTFANGVLTAVGRPAAPQSLTPAQWLQLIAAVAAAIAQVFGRSSDGAAGPHQPCGC
jgi:C1A family cysteine protease